MDSKTELLTYIKTHRGNLDYSYCQSLTRKLSHETDRRRQPPCRTHLARLRKAQKLSRPVLANMVEIPVSMYARYEAGYAFPSEERISRLANCFDIETTTMRAYLIEDLRSDYQPKCTHKEALCIRKQLTEASLHYTPTQIIRSCAAFGCQLTWESYYNYKQGKAYPYQDEYPSMNKALRRLLERARYL